MISNLQVATADDGKRLVVYPLEVSLRDLFAMAALQASVRAWPADDVASKAYEIADAMIRERAK